MVPAACRRARRAAAPTRPRRPRRARGELAVGHAHGEERRGQRLGRARGRGPHEIGTSSSTVELEADLFDGSRARPLGGRPRSRSSHRPRHRRRRRRRPGTPTRPRTNRGRAGARPAAPRRRVRRRAAARPLLPSPHRRSKGSLRSLSMDFSLCPARHRRTGGGYTAGMSDPGPARRAGARRQARVVLAPNRRTDDPRRHELATCCARPAPRASSSSTPGRSDAAHLARLTAFGRVELVLVTHHHPDHTESLAEFARMTDAPVRAIDPAFCIDGDAARRRRAHPRPRGSRSR